MISVLKDFDPKAAAGVMARAALSLVYEGNLPMLGENQDQQTLLKVISEVRSQLGISDEDFSSSAMERITEFLDKESDSLLDPPNTEAALVRLAERGDLPSDLYEINIISNVADIYGKNYLLEKEIIETTIRAPTMEQHFGARQRPYEPTMISIFVRNFRTRWPLKDFLTIVAAKREGFHLHVHQAWRIYPIRVNIAGAKTPVDLLRAFADRYGAEIEVNGERGHFFLWTEGHVATDHIKIPSRRGFVTVSRFGQPSEKPGVDQSALVIAVDSDKYIAMLKELSVRREDMLDEFVPAPKARD